MRYTACQGKVPHDTLIDAKRHIKRPYKNGQHDKLAKQRLDPYKCPDCRKWHVGKTVNAHHVSRRRPPYKRVRLRYTI